MEPLSAPSPLEETASLAHLSGRLAATDRLLKQYRQEQENLLELAQPPLIQDVLLLEQLLENLHSREYLKNRASYRQEILAVVTAPPDLAEVADLTGVIAQLFRLQARGRQMAGLAGTLGALVALPDMAPTQDLEKLIGQTEGVIKKISEKQQARDSLEEALVHKRMEVAELIRETGLCPLCGSPMDVAHFLEAAHG
jgi:hypothetical protein